MLTLLRLAALVVGIGYRLVPHTSFLGGCDFLTASENIDSLLN
jgi:hypothetical protein